MLVAAGSVTPTKTIGILRVFCRRATVAGGLPANPRMEGLKEPDRLVEAEAMTIEDYRGLLMERQAARGRAI
jgi:hypothetical protein